MGQQAIETVIFANSIKHGQHCVAGKTLDGKNWVRPVSNSCGKELTDRQALCRNPYGSFNVKPLQRVTMGISEHVPLINQPENYLIDDSEWQQNYTLREHQIQHYLDRPSDLWGYGNKVSYESIKSGKYIVTQSLYLVEVNCLRLYVNQYNKRRAFFIYNGYEYDLPVTDPFFDSINGNPNVALREILCISLGENLDGDCYKLVASIL